MKQAVVIIHGVGEQKPMGTLRDFVRAVLPASADGTVEFRSKPDRMSDLFGLRRLTSTGRSSTHFYEYYWAYQIDGTTFRHVLQWLWGLLFRSPRNVPIGLKSIYWLTWSAIVLLTLSAALGYLMSLAEYVKTVPQFGVVWIVGAVLFVILQSVLLYRVGDAARYLSSAPSNIAMRQRIRTEGLRLLRRLQRSGRYDRIVIVGHSLGSVIGYDILSRLWLECECDFRAHASEIAAQRGRGKHPQPCVGDVLFRAGQVLNARSLPPALLAFRQAQLDAWKEQRRYGSPWRISDFVTVGSPLAHAMLLMASSAEDFAERKVQRELPTCPPVSEKKRYGYVALPMTLPEPQSKYSAHVLHHAAPFAVTRWTNLYFPAYGGLFGDVIGGAMRNVFGYGIQDIPVRSKSWRRLTLFAHTDYWRKDLSCAVSDVHVGSSTDLQDALTALKGAIDLHSLRVISS